MPFPPDGACPCASGAAYRACCRERWHGDWTQLSPGQLVVARCLALAAGDTEHVFRSYHPDSGFRRQFPALADYQAFAREHLAGRVELLACRVLKEAVSGAEAQVIVQLDHRFGGVLSEMLERHWLQRSDAGWQLLATQKLERSALSGPPERVDFACFDRQADKLIF